MEALHSDVFVFGQVNKEDWLANVSGCTKPHRIGFKGNYVAHYTFLTHRKKYRKYWSKSITMSEIVANLPQELLLLILEHLHPIDLYHCIQTTREFRNLLLNKGSAAIWENSFLAHPDIPFYPEDVSPPKWVSLLFAPDTCDKCGRLFTHVDFVYRERVCMECNSSKLFYDSSENLLSPINHIIRRYPEVELVIWRLLRRTFRSSSAYQCTTISEYDLSTPKYLKKDVIEMAQKLYSLLENSGEDSRQALRQFVIEKEADATRYMEYVKRCETWSNDIYFTCQLLYEGSVSRVLAACEKDLVCRGHDLSDISEARRQLTKSPLLSWSHSRAYKLNKRDTRHVLSALEKESRCQQSKRENALGENAYNHRIFITLLKYREIALRYLKPELASFVPNYRSTLNLPVIQGFVGDKSYRHVGELKVEKFPETEAREHIIHFIHEVIEDRKRTLAELVHTACIESSQKFGTAAEVLKLAMALFEKTCNSENQILIGWDDAGKNILWCHEDTHILPYPDGTSTLPSDPVYHLKYSMTARRSLDVIAGLLAIDLSSSQIQDLDSINRRFFCKSCTLSNKRSVYGLYAMNWRECIQHTFAAQSETELSHCRVPLFDIASDELTESILFLEKPWPNHWEEAWFCRYCSEFLNDHCTRPEVVSHIREEHGVQKPASGTDILYEPHYGCETKREMLFVGLEEISNYRCLRCPAQTKSLRLWRFEDLRRHLVDAHKAPRGEQEEGVDWKKINPVADNVWIREAYNRAKNAEGKQAAPG